MVYSFVNLPLHITTTYLGVSYIIVSMSLFDVMYLQRFYTICIGLFKVPLANLKLLRILSQWIAGVFTLS